MALTECGTYSVIQ